MLELQRSIDDVTVELNGFSGVLVWMGAAPVLIC